MTTINPLTSWVFMTRDIFILNTVSFEFATYAIFIDRMLIHYFLQKSVIDNIDLWFLPLHHNNRQNSNETFGNKVYCPNIGDILSQYHWNATDYKSSAPKARVGFEFELQINFVKSIVERYKTVRDVLVERYSNQLKVSFRSKFYYISAVFQRLRLIS